VTMPIVSMRQLLEAGIHFGHQTRRWNPKMKRYIFAERNGIHIIDLAKTVKGLEEALEFVRQTVAQGDTILFVGTKKQAQEPISEEATRSEMPYVNQRWLGGMLTNFVTIRKRLGLLDQLEARQQNGEFERITKKEASVLTEEMTKLQRTLGGIRKMRRLPGAMFVIDPQREHIAVTEARKLEIPVIGTGDTNVDPDMLDYVIPANDDAIRAIRLLCSLIADAAVEGGRERAARPIDEPVAAVEEQEEASDEMIAALAAGGTFSFEPEPEEEELLPADRPVEAEEPEEEAEPVVARVAPARPAPRAAARPTAARTGAARKPAVSKDKDRDKSSMKEDEEAAS
jgi:small subunit ribosomal protein S2